MQHPDRPRQWTIRLAVMGCVSAWLLYSVVIVVADGLFGLSLPPGPRALIVDASLLAVLFALFHNDDMRLQDFGLRRPSRAGSIRSVVRALLALVVLDALWSAAVGEGSIASPLRGISNASPVVVVLTGLATAVCAPAAEEIFFRGFLYRCLRSRMATLRASVVGGAMFALVHTHYPAPALIPVAFFGVAACLLYEQTGSILPGIALHSFIDASGFELALTGTVIVVPLIAVGAIIGALMYRRLRRTIHRVRAGQGQVGRDEDSSDSPGNPDRFAA
jgi:membrane protease YdiL (CAAX protease family)